MAHVKPLYQKNTKLGKKGESKIKINGRPKMDEAARKSTTIKFRVNEAEKKKFQEKHQSFAPHLNNSEFARTKLLEDNIILFGIRNLAVEEMEMLEEIALLGKQFRMITSRNIITPTQEKLFKEDTQKISEILDSSHRKVLEFQKNELHYSKIGGILGKFGKIISEKEKYQGSEILMNEITLVVESLSEIYQSISLHKK